jgi:hypothetical protein
VQRSGIERQFGTVTKARKIARYFLETENIGIGHLLCHGDDPRQVGQAVATLSALDIPRNQPHQRMPARMKDCTNCR